MELSSYSPPPPRHIVSYKDKLYMIDGTTFIMHDDGFIKVIIIAHLIGSTNESVDD